MELLMRQAIYALIFEGLDWATFTAGIKPRCSSLPLAPGMGC